MLCVGFRLRMGGVERERKEGGGEIIVCRLVSGEW